MKFNNANKLFISINKLRLFVSVLLFLFFVGCFVCCFCRGFCCWLLVVGLFFGFVIFGFWVFVLNDPFCKKHSLKITTDLVMKVNSHFAVKV